MMEIVKKIEKLAETGLAISNLALDIALETVRKTPDWDKVQRINFELYALIQRQEHEKSELKESLIRLENEEKSTSMPLCTEVHFH
jgi:hypothetical protein